MKKFGFFRALLSALVIATLIFFALYFFAPSVANEAFGTSWQSRQDEKAVQAVIEDILEKANVPQESVEAYVKRLKDPSVQRALSDSVQEGKDAVVNFLADIGEEIDLKAIDAQDFKQRIADTFSSSSIAAFSKRQWSAIQRLFGGIFEK
ncbi:MAG: hypothetical protein WC129_00440 [Sphaerochaetaceae bacterium]|nr:hypothetical protein [Spirochaetales bacterium]